MVSATEVRRRMRIRGADGKRLGRVVGVEGDRIHGVTGVLIRRRFDIALGEVQGIDGKELLVSRRAHEGLGPHTPGDLQDARMHGLHGMH